jgi:uncharacterized cupredoxin-like copper-binding protein
VVQVRATDTTCTVDRSSVDSGTIEFAVTNAGTIITEVYLYARHDGVEGEVENVEVGDTGSFSVDVGGGEYEVACKPGQLGDGIRTPLQVTGPLDANQTEASDDATARGADGFSLEVRLTADRFAPELADLVPVTGQTITFKVQNDAPDTRAFAVLGTDGRTPLAQTGELAAGAVAAVPVTFPAAGTYAAVDPISDHRAAGSEVSIRVID